MIEEVRELYAYNRWANDRILEAVEVLDADAFGRDLGSSFPSVRDTLVHVLGAEWVWLERWRGASPTGLPELGGLNTLDEVRSHWAEVTRDQLAFVSGLTDADVDRPVTYRNTRGDTFTNTMGQMLRHVVNHSSYHRGQVVTMLRQLGAEAVSTDLILYYRERPVGEPSLVEADPG